MRLAPFSPAGSLFVRALLWSLLIVPFAAPALFADEAAGKGQLADPFLDKLVGDWHVSRTFPSGRTAENTVHAQWTLNHQWLRLDYRDVATPSKYEATVFIGYDGGKKRYVCHWMDSFGGSYSVLGWGTLDDASHALEISFTDGGGDGKAGDAGGITNRFTYDPKTNSWTSLIRQTEKGEWKVFCEDKFVPAEEKK
jgi:hypothetical protein